MIKYRVSSPLVRNGAYAREYYSKEPIVHPEPLNPNLKGEDLIKYRELFSHISDTGNHPGCFFTSHLAALVAADEYAQLLFDMNKLCTEKLPNIRTYSVGFYRETIKIEEYTGE